MTQAIWNGAVIAESDSTEVVEGNHYFPADSVRWDLLQPSNKRTVCPWKGAANYYDISVEGKTNPNAVWQYQTPNPAAREIKDHVAFWHGVRVIHGPAAANAAVDGTRTGAPGVLRRLFSGRRS